MSSITLDQCFFLYNSPLLIISLGDMQCIKLDNDRCAISSPIVMWIIIISFTSSRLIKERDSFNPWPILYHYNWQQSIQMVVILTLPPLIQIIYFYQTCYRIYLWTNLHNWLTGMDQPSLTVQWLRRKSANCVFNGNINFLSINSEAWKYHVCMFCKALGIS